MFNNRLHFFLDFNRTLKVRQFDKGHKNCHFWALLLKKEDIQKCELFIFSECFFLGFEKTQMSRQVANLGCKLISITDRNFVDNFLQVEIYLALVANI